ncbi:MAG: hypothetical protein NUV63_06065 [Gallionella sp.]|nr:hypothetical protein [Gallionella sp.]
MNKRTLLSLTVLLGSLLCLWHAPAQAARQFSITQSPAAALAEYDMGSTQTLTYTIANTASGGNNCERIYEMRFRLPGTGTVFSSATAPPANWTRTSFSATSVTFRVNSWSNAIDTSPGGGKSCAQGAVTSVAFNLVLVMRTTTADITETLRDARASFTLDTNFANGISRSGRNTANNPGSWTLRALQITSFQTTDLSNNPVSAIYAGTSFRLVITMRNNSSATQNGITASPTPPTTAAPGSKTGTWGGGSPNCSLTSTSPSPLNLAPGASGTITYTCTTASGDSGTVTYATKVRNGTNNATSRTVTSNTLAVSAFVAILSVLDAGTNLPRNCFYLDQNLKISMAWQNNYSFAITGITATLSPTVAGIVTLVSGPTYIPPSDIGAGGVTKDPAVEWVYQITGGTAGQLFGFTGSATGTGSGSPRTTPTASVTNITRGGFNPVVSPGTVNGFSTNQNIEWSITNNGCGQVTKVEITVPAGFTWGGDGYAVVNANDETWGVSGTNPAAFDFTGANPIPLSGSGAFSLVLTTPPGIAVPTDYTFDVGITEDVTGFSTRSTSVTVNPFGSPSLNDTTPGPWREEFR